MTNRPAGARTQRHRSRASMLLNKLVTMQHVELDTLAAALTVTDATLDAYLAESLAIPLERQLRLALFVIESVPALARTGHQLRGQVAAAMALEARVTETHLQPPPTTWFQR
jgi:hypothetical protein